MVGAHGWALLCKHHSLLRTLWHIGWCQDTAGLLPLSEVPESEGTPTP